MKKERRNTLDDVVLVYSRMAGNTTRQVDKAIDLLFKGYIVEVRDHWEGGTFQRANKELFDRVMRRLYTEHNGKWLQENGKLRIDKQLLIIELL